MNHVATLRSRIPGIIASGLALVTIIGFLGPFAWWLDIFSNFRVHYALIATLLLIVALALGQKKTAVFSALLLAVNGVVVTPYLSAITVRAASPTVKVITFNLWEGNYNAGPTLDFLRREKADIVVLSEATDHWQQGLSSLSDIYPYRLDRLNCGEFHHCEMVLLSKIPWEKTGVSGNNSPSPPLLWARFNFGGSRFTVAGIHFAMPLGRLQRSQINGALEVIKRLDGPLVLAGDFNATPWSYLLPRIEKKAVLRRASGGISATWPSALMGLGIPIDHVLVSPGIKYATMSAGPRLGSDHRPIIAELGF